jgi:hypothetical protein
MGCLPVRSADTSRVMVAITSSRLLANSYSLGSGRKMGTTKTRGVILAGEGEVDSSSPARLPKEGESGHWMESVSMA